MKCDYRDEECVRAGHDCACCNVVNMHLCDTCKKTYPECDGKNVKIGCDIDTYPNTRQNKDNIFYCDGYVKREKKNTNADRIRSFSDEELAEFIGILAEGNEDCAKCPFFVHSVKIFLVNVQDFFTNNQKDLVYYTYNEGSNGESRCRGNIRG